MVQPPTRQRRQRLQHSALRRSVQESVPQGQWNPTKRARGNVAKFQGRNFLTAILLTHVEVGSTPRCAAFSRRCAVFFRPFGHPHPSVTVYDRCTRRWAARGRGKRCGGPPNACRSVRCVLCGCMRRFVAAAAAVGCLGVPALLQVACGGQVLPETVERKAPKARRGDDAVCVGVLAAACLFTAVCRLWPRRVTPTHPTPHTPTHTPHNHSCMRATIVCVCVFCRRLVPPFLTLLVSPPSLFSALVSRPPCRSS